MFLAHAMKIATMQAKSRQIALVLEDAVELCNTIAAMKVVRIRRFDRIRPLFRRIVVRVFDGSFRRSSPSTVILSLVNSRPACNNAVCAVLMDGFRS